MSLGICFGMLSPLNLKSLEKLIHKVSQANLSLQPLTKAISDAGNQIKLQYIWLSHGALSFTRHAPRQLPRRRRRVADALTNFAWHLSLDFELFKWADFQLLFE